MHLKSDTFRYRTIIYGMYWFPKDIHKWKIWAWWWYINMCVHMMYTTLRSFFLYFENSGYHIKMTKSIFCAVLIILTLGLFGVLPTFKILYCFRCQNKWYLHVFKLYFFFDRADGEWDSRRHVWRGFTTSRLWCWLMWRSVPSTKARNSSLRSGI